MCCAHSAGESVGTCAGHYQVFNWSARLLTWRRDVDAIYTTDLVLGVAEPVVAIREGLFTF
jgi:hypothetical protein